MPGIPLDLPGRPEPRGRGRGDAVDSHLPLTQICGGGSVAEFARAPRRAMRDMAMLSKVAIARRRLIGISLKTRH